MEVNTFLRGRFILKKNGQCDIWGEVAYNFNVKTLFLDFDGVIHPEFCHESRHFCCLPMFEQVLRRCKDWDVVITSTWRLQRSFESLRAVFSGDVASRVLGVTPRFAELNDVPNSLLGYEREAECNAWLRENDRIVFPWLAIDDRSWLFRPFNSSVFLVDGKTGLTAEVAEELTERLLKL